MTDIATTRRPAVSLRRPTVREILTALLRADLTALVKNPRRAVLSLLLPLLLLIVTDSAKSTQHLGGTLFVLGLSIAYGLLSASVLGYSLSIARDRENGIFQRLRVTPAPPWTIMVSRLGVQMIANVVMALVVLVIGAQIHHVTLSVSQYLLVLAISVLAGAVYLTIGQALVGLVKSADTVNAAGRMLLILLYVFGLFGQSGALGGIWESISRWSPVGAVMNLFAGVLDLSTWSSTDWWALVACAGYIVVCGAVGIRYFQWEAR